MTYFSSIQIDNWRQYDKIDIEFDRRVTIITGSNGAGKTTIINVVGGMIGWGTSYGSVPEIDKNTGITKYKIFTPKNKRLAYDPQTMIGRISMSDGSVMSLYANESNAAQYGIGYSWASISAGTVPSGVYIKSHRPVFSYAAVSFIPTNARGRNEAYQDYTTLPNTGYGQKTSVQSIKESLISMAAFGYGNQVIVANLTAKHNFERFQVILSKLLPKSIGFRRLAISMPEVILETDSGRFTIDSVSGGLASLIDLAWKIFTFAPESGEFVVAIDEPENHLHPELQKSILVSLTDAFPEAQFIVVTHSPFIISSFADAKIYVLRFDKNDRVYSEHLNLVEKAATSNEILKDVLGIESTLPIWAENSLNEIIARYQKAEITDVSLELLRNELEKEGLGSFVPDAIMEIIKDEK